MCLVKKKERMVICVYHYLYKTWHTDVYKLPNHSSQNECRKVKNQLICKPLNDIPIFEIFFNFELRLTFAWFTIDKETFPNG